MKHANILLLVIALFAFAPAAGAQDSYLFRASLTVGAGGSVGSGATSRFDSESFQLGFLWETDEDTLVGIRYGELDFDDSFGSARPAQLSYLTVAGEYRFNEGFYQSGLYLGLGIYRMDSRGAPGRDDETGLGLTLGLTGEFSLSKRFSILLELSGHYAFLDALDVFAVGHGGLVYRF